ncbi:hypothetical protein B9Z19DRAFT_89789 [Tuber borchii]|uniref:Uncharacterized protein n=1 Tax=Tuber borchii TaxID=42251 RepID=A0A2T6ZRY4_TUBBO|nr:hypothetical protein B9Z19DRAFT_89789 [Tuber borchii]
MILWVVWVFRYACACVDCIVIDFFVLLPLLFSLLFVFSSLALICFSFFLYISSLRFFLQFCFFTALLENTLNYFSHCCDKGLSTIRRIHNISLFSNPSIAKFPAPLISCVRLSDNTEKSVDSSSPSDPSGVLILRRIRVHESRLQALSRFLALAPRPTSSQHLSLAACDCSPPFPRNPLPIPSARREAKSTK